MEKYFGGGTVLRHSFSGWCNIKRSRRGKKKMKILWKSRIWIFFMWCEITSERVSDDEKQSIDENSHRFFAHEIQIPCWIIYFCKKTTKTWRKFNLHCENPRSVSTITFKSWRRQNKIKLKIFLIKLEIEDPSQSSSLIVCYAKAVVFCMQFLHCPILLFVPTKWD